jgi:hypothetical protein
MGEQTLNPLVEEESVSNEPGGAADVGDDSIAYVPEATEQVDTPDVDQATHPQEEEEEPETTEPEEEAAPEEAEEEEVEVEEHPEISKEDLEKEITELQEKARLAKEKADYWTQANREARAAHFQGRDTAESTEIAPVTPEVSAEPPKEEDFEDYNEYVVALTDFQVTQKMAEYDKEAHRRALDTAHQEKRANLATKLEKGSEKYSDFDEIVQDPLVPITEAIIDILADTDYPAEIAYHLATNLSEATKISRMPPLAAAKAIGKIEAKIEADEQATPAEEKPVAAPKKTTNAPAPIKPVKAGTSVVSKDPAKMSNEEYRAWRQGKK